MTEKTLSREVLEWGKVVERHPLPWFSMEESQSVSVVVDARGDTVAIVRSNSLHSVAAARAMAIGFRLLREHEQGKLTWETMDKMLREWEHGQRIVVVDEDE